MNPFSKKPLVAAALKRKGVTTVGELKKKVGELEGMNLQMEGMLKAEGPKAQAIVKKIEKHKVSNPGVHAKKKASKLKGSKNYLKRYRGQGK